MRNLRSSGESPSKLWNGRRGTLAAFEFGPSPSYTRLISADGGRPVLLPVWIGAYRRGDRLFRVVINGQTGAFTGTAPISLIKVFMAIAVGLGLLTLVIALLSAAEL